MSRRKLSSADYSAEARIRLGKALEATRIAHGYNTRPEFLKAYPKGPKSRSLEKVELGEAVGSPTFQRLAGIYPGWTMEKFQEVLEGGPIPAMPIRPPTSLDVQWHAQTRVTGEIAALLESQPVAAGVLRDTVDWRRQFKDAGLGEDDLFTVIEQALARAKLLQLDSNQQPFG